MAMAKLRTYFSTDLFKNLFNFRRDALGRALNNAHPRLDSQLFTILGLFRNQQVAGANAAEMPELEERNKTALGEAILIGQILSHSCPNKWAVLGTLRRL
jgi:hypothetical protein